MVSKKEKEKERRARAKDRQSRAALIRERVAAFVSGNSKADSGSSVYDVKVLLSAVDSAREGPQEEGMEDPRAGSAFYVLEPLDAAAEAMWGVGSAVRREQEAPAKLAPGGPEEGKKDEEDVVVLPAPSPVSEPQRPRSVSTRKCKRSWSALKLAVLRLYGAAGLELVEPHDGNAEDPVFTVSLKYCHRGSVSVPRHWDRLRPFLSNVVDRSAAAVVPRAMKVLDVKKQRADRQHGASSVDQLMFMSTFLSGSPLKRRDFGVREPLLLRGDLFYERRWLGTPSEFPFLNEFTPGKLSVELSQALGLASPESPPPWLRSMQAARRLPPAYPYGFYAGVNAPIPLHSRQGGGGNEWGSVLLTKNDTVLFPGVMEDREADRRSLVETPGWGAVPGLRE